MRFFNRSRSKLKPSSRSSNVCVVAILKEEDKFIDEWLTYHRLLGVDHFYLYDNDPRLPLKRLTQPHAEYVTVIDWLVDHDYPLNPDGTKQIKAFNHFLKNFGAQHEWVAFVDVDEFITLREHKDLKIFLQDFARFDAISLHWHVFGHNGYYNDPDDLILAALTRRQQSPSINIKSISRISAITAIESAHFAQLKNDRLRVDANKKEYKDHFYPGKTKVANINHYQCKSFTDWMKRPARGDVGAYPAAKEQRWRFEEEACLIHFVRIFAKDRNEFVDEYMLRYVPLIKNYLLSLKDHSLKTSSLSSNPQCLNH